MPGQPQIRFLHFPLSVGDDGKNATPRSTARKRIIHDCGRSVEQIIQEFATERVPGHVQDEGVVLRHEQTAQPGDLFDIVLEHQ